MHEVEEFIAMWDRAKRRWERWRQMRRRRTNGKPRKVKNFNRRCLRANALSLWRGRARY